MDFLRDFRHASRPGDQAEWVPSSEVVLDVADLSQDRQLTEATYAYDDTRTQHRYSGSRDWASPVGQTWAPTQQVQASPPPIGYCDQPAAVAGAATGPGTPSFATRAARTARSVRLRLLRAKSSRLGLYLRPIAIVVAVAVVLAVVGVVVVGQLGGSSTPAAWTPGVAPLATFVQTERGLTWKHPVRVDFLSDAAFAQKVDLASGVSAKAQAQEAKLLDVVRALGLVWGRVGTSQVIDAVADSGIVGFYQPTDQIVFVQGTTLTLDVRVTLVAALTEALDGEYFDLNRMESGAGNDEQAVSALIDGDADRIQQVYDSSLSAPLKAELASEARAAQARAGQSESAQEVPPFLTDQLAFPDDFGPTLVETLLQQGGVAELNAAFSNPPSVDAQVVDPTSYVPGLHLPNVQLAAAPSGAKVVQTASGFGEVPLVEMLGYEIGFKAAWSAVQGWTADRFDGYQIGDRSCADLSVLDDSVADATRLATAAHAWARSLRTASVSQSGTTVRFEACDPGSGWTPSAAGYDPYRGLATRAFWLYELMTTSRMNPVNATCVTNEMLGTVGPGPMTQVENGASAASPVTSVVGRAVAQAVDDCGYNTSPT